MSNKLKFILILAFFLAAFFIPFSHESVQKAILESFLMLQDYAQKHIILCLIPAFFIAGAISVFLSPANIIKYLGAKANKILSYAIASVSGSILAVCSCTVLPLFSGIYRMGAGIGPATAFLYSGPAINIMAIVLTARVLGLQIGLARAIGAVLSSLIIGVLMAITFRHEKRNTGDMVMPDNAESLTGARSIIFFILLISILVFANWSSAADASGFFSAVYSVKWYITGIAGILLSFLLIRWFRVKWYIMAATAILTIISVFIFPSKPLISFSIAIIGIVTGLKFSSAQGEHWLEETKSFAFQILPLLFAGVMAAGFLLGMPNSGNGIIPQHWVASLVGGNSLSANLFASVVGAFMYFATLTEVPILQGLLNAGMGKGPALALLLAGPALSLPNMLVIRSVLGNKKTITFVGYVIILSTVSGMIFGIIVS